MSRPARSCPVALPALLACWTLCLLWPLATTAAAQTVYNKYTIHTFQNERDIRASYANWTDPGPGHGRIPPSTPMTIEPWRNGFILHTKGTPPQTVYFLYDEGRMQLPVDAYIRLITAPQPVPPGNFNPADLEGIRLGRALPGMTKEGVLTALGYPAKHRTPSLDSPEWVYWKNRFSTLVVVFDPAGLVNHIRE